MSKKKTAVLISTVVLIVAAVTAIIVFRRQIEEFLGSHKKSGEFTPEEKEVFADI